MLQKKNILQLFVVLFQIISAKKSSEGGLHVSPDRTEPPHPPGEARKSGWGKTTSKNGRSLSGWFRVSVVFRCFMETLCLPYLWSMNTSKCSEMVGNLESLSTVQTLYSSVLLVFIFVFSTTRVDLCICQLSQTSKLLNVTYHSQSLVILHKQEVWCGVLEGSIWSLDINFWFLSDSLPNSPSLLYTLEQ